LARRSDGVSTGRFLQSSASKRRIDGCTNRTKSMLKWAVIFAVIAIIAGLFGFTGIAAGAAGVAKILFIVFLVLFVAVVLFALLGIGAATKK
jgi:uncharacterized membrane protein YtjA (UPF0391 family)